jgi:hypothetical protein
MASFFEIINDRTRNDHTKEELVHCSVCGSKLEAMDMYVIAKAYHDGKCILEAVQCVDCQLEARDYVSEQSLENITLYSGRRFNEFVQDPMQRRLYHLEDPSCLITGETLMPNDSFEIYSFNIPGAQLDDHNFLFVGPTAIEQMSELLSEETRRSWERYTDTLVPDSPEIVISPMFF